MNEMVGWNNSSLEGMIGKKVYAVFFTDDCLSFITNNGTFNYDAEGDCCSNSWYFRLRGLSNLAGEVVTKIVEIDTSDVNPDDGLCRQDQDEVNGIGVVTELGVFEIVYRNSSNGYYGGNLRLSTKKDLPVGAVELLSDWQATTRPE